MELELSKAEINANKLIEEAQEIEKKDELLINNSISLENELNLEESKNVKQFTKIVGDILDKGINYAIKSLPIADGIKEVALDVKEALKSNDFKEIIKTAVGSSIREGLEFLKMPTTILKDIKSLQSVALNGGLTKMINAGVDIVCNKYLKNNIFSDIGKTLITSIKSFVSSKEFVNKLKEGFDKFNKKIDDFKQLCTKWYEAYEKFDIEMMNKTSKEVLRKSKIVQNSTECDNQNSIIQNITKMVNNTRQKLSPIQLDVCKSL